MTILHQNIGGGSHKKKNMQTRLGSLVETLISLTIGFLISLASQVLIFPLYDIHTSMSDNIEITLYFTIISVVRSFTVRRFFNNYKKNKSC